MGMIANAVRASRGAITVIPQRMMEAQATPQNAYLMNARKGYAGNEIVYSAIELLASSAGEPHISGRRTRRESPTRALARSEIRNAKAELVSRGIRRPNAALVRSKFVEELPSHPLVELLNAPNLFVSRGQMWGTVVMDLKLAGNAYLYKARSPGFKMPLELWRLRPDRVKVIPSEKNFIEGYEYRTGNETVFYPAADIVHFKTRNPFNEYYGMPPLMPILGRIDIDYYMQSFLKTFFETGGSGPGAILSTKTRLSEDNRTELRNRHKRMFGGASGFHELMVLDNTETTYQQMGLNRGLRDALPKELDAVSEARIAMVFGIPGSILGLLIGYESSSYANKRADWQVLWDVTMTPMLSDLDDVLNLCLVPDFTGIDEVYFDLDDIKALQEDVDAVQERERKNWEAGLLSWEEGRDAIGRDPGTREGFFKLPTNVEIVRYSQFGEEPQLPSLPPKIEQAEVELPETVAEARCPSCSRWVGRNLNAGAVVYCPKCKEVPIG